MLDVDIEAIIVDAVERLFEETDFILTFASTKEDGFEAVLDEHSKWQLKHNADPLSLVLYFSGPIPIKTSDDNICVGTIMKMWGKNAAWVRSFQDGVGNRYNSSSSINGYWAGMRARKKIDVIIEANSK